MSWSTVSNAFFKSINIPQDTYDYACYFGFYNLVPRLFLRGRKDPDRSWSRGSQKINCLRGCGKSIILHASTSALNTSIAGVTTHTHVKILAKFDFCLFLNYKTSTC